MKLQPLVLRVGCFFILLGLSSMLFAASEPAFWRVSNGKAVVYLMGSMHFGDEEFYPLPKEIDAAYEHSSVLVVEVDIASITPEMASKAIYQHGRLPLGQTLSQQLSADVYRDLTQRSEKANLPLAALERFQPWFVAVQLIEAEIRKTRLRQDLGVDLHFINKGEKSIVELETLEHQLSLFGTLSMAEQEKFLAQTLSDMDNSQAYLAAMADAWLRGDTKNLEETLITPFEENVETKKLFQKIFTERNDKMAKAVTRYLANEKNVFFVVGIGHMLGKQGIVAQLRRQGFKVERVKFEQSADESEKKGLLWMRQR